MGDREELFSGGTTVPRFETSRVWRGSRCAPGTRAADTTSADSGLCEISSRTNAKAHIERRASCGVGSAGVLSEPEPLDERCAKHRQKIVALWQAVNSWCVRSMRICPTRAEGS